MNRRKTLEQAMKICDELLRNWDIEQPEKIPFMHRFKKHELDNPDEVNWVLEVRESLLNFVKASV